LHNSQPQRYSRKGQVDHQRVHQERFEEGERVPEEVMRKIGISEFSTKPTNFYNLDVIISVGYQITS